VAGGSKSKFVIFANKNQLKSNKLCYRVSLCENIQQQSCREPFLYLTVYIYIGGKCNP